MRSYCKLGLAGILIASLGFVSIRNISKETPPVFVEMEVKGVRFDVIGQSPMVLLSDKEGKKVLPIWIGLPEANAIEKELQNASSPRPMTHDLLHSILTKTHVKVKEVKIVYLKENTYYATLLLTLHQDVIEVDARPSDAIVLALKSKAPILVSFKILNEQGIALTQKEVSGERYGMRVQELTPSLASHFNFKGKKGVLVSEVIAGSASEASRIRAGDIILKINLREVGTVQEVEEILDAAKEESSLRILLFRDETFQEVNLLLKP